MRLPLLAALLAAASLGVSDAGAEMAGRAGTGELSIYVMTERVSWRGSQPGMLEVEDEGQLGGVGVRYSFAQVPRGLHLTATAEFSGGEVGSTGITTGGLPLPTRATWYGFRVESDVGIPLLPGESGWNLEPLAGLGYRWRVRDLHDATTSNGYGFIFVPGSVETWQSLYGYVGARVGRSLPNSSRLSVELSGRRSFINLSEAELPFVGAAASRPEGTWTIRAALEYCWKGTVSELYYETFRYKSHASLANLAGAGVNGDLLGFRFGWRF